jgi:flavin-dependent dehydrogenase
MRFRGDFQGFENWSTTKDILDEIKSMNINCDFWYKPITKAEFYDYKLNKRIVSFERPGLYLVRRGSFSGSLDFSLKNQAINNNVEIIFNKRINEKDSDIIAGGPRRVDGIVRGIVFETKTTRIPTIILDDRLAPKSFAYLLTGEGFGCLGAGLTKNYTLADKLLDKTIKSFKSMIDLDISNPKRFTGYGNFFIKNKYVENDRIYAGEAAGLQDYLLAFGLRHAITSGYLAARSIIFKEDYNKLIKQRFSSQLKISMTNRFLYSLAGNKGYSKFLERGKKIKDPLKRMNRQYNASAIKFIFYPFAKLRYRK